MSARGRSVRYEMTPNGLTRIATVNGSGAIALGSSELAATLHVKPGDDVRVTYEPGRIIITNTSAERAQDDD